MSDSTTDTNQAKSFDRFGSVASSLCAVHCALCALLPTAFAALGLGYLMGHRVEWIFTIVAILFALGALYWGRNKHRERPLPAILLVVGICGLLGSRVIEMQSGHDHGHHGAEHGHGEHHDDHEAGHEKEHADHHNEGHGHEEHADHHDDHHHGEKAHAESGAHNEQADHHDDHEEHGGALHKIGGILGIVSGLLLLCGHLLNLRKSKPCNDSCP